MKAIILAGGLGTRLRERVNDKPKVLADILGKPFLEYQLNWINKSKIIKTVIIAACYKADQIAGYLKENIFEGLEVKIVVEPEALGTGGSVKHLSKKLSLSENLLIMNGDTYYDFELDEILSRIDDRKKLSTIICCKMNCQERYGNIEIKNDKAVKFLEKNIAEETAYVNAGMYLIHADYFLNIPLDNFSLETYFIQKLVSADNLQAHILEGSNRFYDIGTVEAYDKISVKGF